MISTPSCTPWHMGPLQVERNGGGGGGACGLRKDLNEHMKLKKF